MNILRPLLETLNSLLHKDCVYIFVDFLIKTRTAAFIAKRSIFEAYYYTSIVGILLSRNRVNINSMLFEVFFSFSTIQ